MTSVDSHKEILSAMVIAPSAHNTQPWKFSVREGAIDIFVEWSRHLTVSDPTQRQLYASIGCTIENGLIAAENAGFNTQVAYFPEGEGDDKPAARLQLIEDGKIADRNNDLFKAIPNRRTNRNIYQDNELTNEQRQQLDELRSDDVFIVTEREEIQQLAEVSAEATAQALARKDFKQELSQWIRNSWTRQPDGMPGYATGMPAPLSLIGSFMIRNMPIHKPEASKTMKQIQSSLAVLLIATEGDSKQDWMKAGRLMERAWLKLTAAGFAAAPIANAIEASDATRQRVRKVLDTNRHPQVFIRIGHSKQQRLKATPRRTVEDCLK